MQILPKITYIPINPEFSYGNYLGTNVIIMTKNGYVNATKLCTSFGKQLKSWVQNNDITSYLLHENSQFSASGIPIMEIIPNCDINDGPVISGIYFHPEIIIQLAIWISFDVFRNVTKIVTNYTINSFRNQICDKNTKIDELSKHNLEINMKNIDLIIQNKFQRQEIDNLSRLKTNDHHVSDIKNFESYDDLKSILPCISCLSTRSRICQKANPRISRTSTKSYLAKYEKFIESKLEINVDNLPIRQDNNIEIMRNDSDTKNIIKENNSVNTHHGIG